MIIPNWSRMYSYYRSLPKHPDGDYYSCAIRLSMTLYHVGAFKKPAYKQHRNKVSPNGWAMVAEELYQWLRIHDLGEAQLISISQDDSSLMPAQNGIIYLRNCFLRATDLSPEGRTGDHFDLYVAGQGMLSAILWPSEFPDGPFGLIKGCRDKKIRFWPTS